MDLLDISLIFSITLCSLVSGFIFTYAIIVMPGLSDLNDKEFIRAFQVTDAVIQNNHVRKTDIAWIVYLWDNL